MTVSAFSTDELREIENTVREIGTALLSARQQIGETQLDCAHRTGVHLRTISRVEDGTDKSIQLSTAIRLLAPYGLEIGVAPSMPGDRGERIAKLVDRILALPGGEDLLRHHLKRRGLELSKLARRSDS